MQRIVCFCVCLFLMGCQPFEHGNKVKQAAYQAGYRQGCQSAVEDNGNPLPDLGSEKMLDQDRYQQDAAYRSGWRAGFHSCRQAWKSALTDSVVLS